MMLRAITGFAIAASLLAGFVAFATVSIDRSEVENITIVGELEEAHLVLVKDRLSDLSVSTSDVETVQKLVAELPFVHHANVRKLWPSGMEVEIELERAIAYWNNDGFISEEGEVLITDVLEAGDLPHFYGPDGSAFTVMTQYQQLTQLLQSHGHDIRLLRVSDRGAWSLETGAGIELLLGKEDLVARMQRFLTVASRLEEQGDVRTIERMDARYVNGVAVHFENNNQIADVNQRVGERSL